MSSLPSASTWATRRSAAASEGPLPNLAGADQSPAVNQSFRLEDQEQDDGGADRHLLDVGDPLLYCGKHIGQAGRRGLHDLRQMNAVPSNPVGPFCLLNRTRGAYKDEHTELR